LDGQGDYALGIALRYLRVMELEGKPDAGAVWCFDGGNRRFRRSGFLRVEFVSRPVV
jgi:hypothetical protein